MARERKGEEPLPADDFGAGGREGTVESELPSSHLPGSLEHVGEIDEIEAGIVRGAARADEPDLDADADAAVGAPGGVEVSAATDIGDADSDATDEAGAIASEADANGVAGEGHDPDAAYDPDATYEPDATYDPDVAYEPDAAYEAGASYDPDAGYDSATDETDAVQADGAGAGGGGAGGGDWEGPGYGDDGEPAGDDAVPSEESGGSTTTTRVARAGGAQRPRPAGRPAPGRERSARVRREGEEAEQRENLLARALAFLRASWAELQRVQWPDRRHTFQATAVVVGFVIVAGVYLGVADWVAGKLVNLVI